MVVNKYLDELLLRYDIYHSSVRYGNKVVININYKAKDTVDVVVSKVKSGRKKDTTSCHLQDDFNFRSSVLPKLLQHFFSKNTKFVVHDVMGTKDRGTRSVTTIDENESLVIRNCTNEVMELVGNISSVIDLSRKVYNSNIIKIDSQVKESLRHYIFCNMAMDYAKYREDFIDDNGYANFFSLITRKSYLLDVNRTNDEIGVNLTILEVARLGYSLGYENNLKAKTSVWEEIKERYRGDLLILKICDEFITLQENRDTIYNKALTCAEFENKNEDFIMGHQDLIKEALSAVKNKIFSTRGGFVEYWDKRRREYANSKNSICEKICTDFMNSQRLILVNKSDDKNIEVLEDVKEDKKEVKIKEETKTEEKKFITDIPKSFVDDTEHFFLVSAANNQARQLINALNEREKIKRDAEEFAKQLLLQEKEHKKLLQNAKMQAEEIFKLQKENELLRSLALDNAKNIFKKDLQVIAYQNAKQILKNENSDEFVLHEVDKKIPVSFEDVDKLTYLYNYLSEVKNIDFAVNHPTVMQQIINLEEKIVSYLSMHKVVPDKEKKKMEEEKFFEEEETKEELLDAIKKVYNASHSYEKDGRHTVIEIVPLLEKYRVTLYSVKDESNDILTEVYFKKSDFTDDVIKQLCDIYKENAVIVASKIDNIPSGLGDYTVIDNQNNTIKFLECERSIIGIADTYL